MILQLLVIFAFSSSCAYLTNLNLVAEWKELEYDYPTDAARQAALNSRACIPGNGFLLDVAVHYSRTKVASSSGCSIMNILKCLPKRGGNRITVHVRDISRVFVTVPRMATGVPLTLATISDKPGKSGPLLSPYPNWRMNDEQTCSGLKNVYRVATDECNRLWVLDSGRVVGKQLCPPKLVVFNLTDDSVIRTFQFPSEVYKSKSLLITLVVDVRNTKTCADTMVYVADELGFGVIVYNNQQNTAWRFENKLFYPNPDYATYTIEGISFDMMDGIFGMALSPKGSPNRQLYFHSLASAAENRVALSVLDDRNNVNSDPRNFVEIGKRCTQSTAEAMDRNGNLFFGLISPIAVACWDSSQSQYDANRIRVVAQNNNTLQFTGGMKVVKNNLNQEELWVLSNRYQRFANGTLSSKEVNFRVLAAKIDTILDGSNKCTSSVGASLADY